MPHTIEAIASTRKKTKESIRVDSLFPRELRDPAKTLIGLLEDYYTHVNEVGQPSAEINSMVEARDLDSAKADYLDLLQKEIAAVIPKNTVANRVNLYKNLSRYYNVRGSQESIELFFKIIFQDNVEVYFPRKDMLIASDGVWVAGKQRPIYSTAPLFGVIGNGTGAKGTVTTVNGAIRRITLSSGGTLYPCPTASITGDGSNATLLLYVAGGVVRSIVVTNGGSGYTSATVNITGTHDSAASATATIVNGSIASVTINDGGSGYASPTVTIADTRTEGILGSGATARAYCAGGVIQHVEMLTYGSKYSNGHVSITFGGATGAGAVAGATVVDGAITEVVPTSYGEGYDSAKVSLDGIMIDDAYPNSTHAQIIANIERTGADIGQIKSYRISDCGQGYTIAGNFLGYSTGGYDEHRGFLSDTIKLQDSYFYQKFSYVIRTGNNYDVWADTFNKLVHPAGMIFFGEILILLLLLDSQAKMPLIQKIGYISAEDLAQIIVLQALNNMSSTYASSSYRMALNVPTGTSGSLMMKFFDGNAMQVYGAMSIEAAETLYPYDDYTISYVINNSPAWNGTTLGVNYVS